jgi:hypothetical protein
LINDSVVCQDDFTGLTHGNYDPPNITFNSDYLFEGTIEGDWINGKWFLSDSGTYENCLLTHSDYCGSFKFHIQQYLPSTTPSCESLFLHCYDDSFANQLYHPARYAAIDIRAPSEVPRLILKGLSECWGQNYLQQNETLSLISDLVYLSLRPKHDWMHMKLEQVSQKSKHELCAFSHQVNRQFEKLARTI